MKVPRTELAKVIAERTLHVRDQNLLTREIAAYLLSENRVNELGSLMRDVLAYRESKGVIEANVLSAHELSESVKKDVAHLLRDHYPEAKKVTIHEQLDPAVIGGLKVQLAHEQLDLSIRAKLDTFKRITSEGNV
jgi:F0F1-type ATP synthase delta subunit